MNILLIYPRYGYPNLGGIYAPLGLQYLASVIRNAGHKVALLDTTFHDKMNVEEKHLDGIDVVGISFSTPLANKAYEVLRYIRFLKPGQICIAGGPHPTIRPEECLANGFDVAVIGEGEKTVIDVLAQINSGSHFNGVNGIAFQEEGKTVLTTPREFIQNLDEIPVPARDLIDWEAYFRVDRAVTVMTSRGCPFNCIFCKPMQDMLFGKRIRRRTPRNVVDELQGIGAQIRRDNFYVVFVDDTFLLSKEWVLSFCDELLDRGLKIRWTCQSRVDAVTETLLKTMKTAGCFHLSFGVESGSQKILDYLRKGVKIEDTIRSFDLCRNVGINTHAYVIVGSPTETRDDLQATIKLIKRVRPTSVRTTRLTPIVGSDLYESTFKDGLLNVQKAEEYDYFSKAYPLKLAHLTEKDLNQAEALIRSINTNWWEWVRNHLCNRYWYGSLVRRIPVLGGWWARWRE